jgi:hypothetical protein
MDATEAPATNPPAERRGLRAALILLGLTLLLHAGIVFSEVRSVGRIDLLDTYLQVRTALRGQGPYDIRLVKPAYVEHLRRHGIGEGYALSNGFYYPPEAMLLYLPLSVLPWSVAEPLWVVTLTAAAVACGTLAWTFGGGPAPRPLAGAGIVAALLLNPLTQAAIGLGQSALAIAGAIALGQWAFERGRHRLGVLAWSFAAIKPHLGIAFLALAFVLGGWRRARDLLLAIVVLNLLGCLLVTGRLTTLVDYYRYLKATHMAHAFNRVTFDQVLSWNRLVYLAGGPEINLGAASILSSYAVFGALLALRGAWGGDLRRWTPAFWLAATVTATLLCTQAKGYDMVLMVLLAPLILWLIDRRLFADALFLGALIAVASVPKGALQILCGHAGAGPGLVPVVLSHRAFVVAALALYVLVRAQPRPAYASAAVIDGAPRSAGPGDEAWAAGRGASIERTK